MPPDSVFFTTDLNSLADWARFISQVVAIISGLVGLIIIFLNKFLPWYRARRRSKILEKRVGAELYSKGIIEQTIRYYIEPECQSLDPAGGEEQRLVYSVRQNLFAAVDNMLNNPTEYRYLLILADSGMGKTSFMINYYARNLFQGKKFELVLLPLGISDVDERIQNIDAKENKILFLDAFDEDTLAIVDHVERLKTLMELTSSFHKIIITCRTQFFPKDEEIPEETGIVKVGPRRAGERAIYIFHKLYLSPFTDQQVEQYLKKRYSLWQIRNRRKAREMAAKIPDLRVRPMLLAHIDDLVHTNRDIKYCYELYEEMVEAWLLREEKTVVGLKKEPLRQFSEQLAIDLFVNREERGSERIPHTDLGPLAKKWNIPLDDWQLKGRSLLNRDAKGNYKFAHRSIMEYLFVKRMLDLAPDLRPKIKLTDQMCRFLLEKIWKINLANLATLQMRLNDLAELILQPAIYLRNTSSTLSSVAVKLMLKKYGFFDDSVNKTGKGIAHRYVLLKIASDQVVIDGAMGLIWQQGGSSNYMKIVAAQDYVKKMNSKCLAGFNDWRLPTLEEAMSLMEPKQLNGDLYIDPVFDKAQGWIWTADAVQGASRWWVVDFDYGYCSDVNDYYYYVRLVRSGHSLSGR